MGNILAKTLRVEEKELPLLLWVIFFGALLGIYISILDVTAISTFLLHHNASYLPGAIICSGLLGVFTANTFISLKNWVSFAKIANITLLSLIFLSIAVYIIPDSNSKDWTYIGFVLTGPINSLVLLLFWGLFENFFDLAQSKKVAVTGEGGMVLASVIVLSIIAFSNSEYYHNPDKLYVLSLYHLMAALVAFWFISYFYPFLTKIVINVQYIKEFTNYKKLIRQRYVMWMVLFSFLSSIAFYITDFTFLQFVSQSYSGLKDTMSFIAVFMAITIGVAFLLQIFVLKWVHLKYGYQVGLLMLPVLLGLFSLIYGVLGSINSYDTKNSVFFFIFMIVVISKAITICLYRSIEFSTFKYFFMPLESLLREDIQAKIERVIREAGKFMAGLMALMITAYFNFSFVPYVALLIIGGWAYVTIKMNKAYRVRLKLSLDKPEEIKKRDRVNSGIIEKLVANIGQSDVRETELNLSLLKTLDPIAYKQCILQLLESNDEEIQRMALLETSVLCLLPALPVLDKLKESKFYPVLKTRDLIDKAYEQLKAAEFRLEKIKYIEQLTLSKLRKERVFGALLAAYSDDSIKPKLLNKLFRDSDSKVRFSAVVSSSNSANTDLHKNLIDKLGDTFYGNGALSAVIDTKEKMYAAMESAFYISGQDEKIQRRIIQAYGRLGDEEAVQLLFKKLNYTNQNLAKSAFEAVSGCGYVVSGERVMMFKAELEEYVGVLVWNISVLLDLKSYKVSAIMLQAVEAEIEDNYKSLFKLLSLLYEPKTIALIQENIFSADPEKSEYAFGLLEVTIEDGIKPYILPVFSNLSLEDKLVKMQEFYPTEKIELVEALHDLVQRDYKYVNRWTKACALKELSEINKKFSPDIFIANVINPDPLMKETASVSLYIRNSELFPDTFERFKQDLGKGFSKEIINKINSKGFDTNTKLKEEAGEVVRSEYFNSPDLKFETIKFLRSVHDLSSVPGIVLMELARKAEYYKFEVGERIAYYEDAELIDYFIVRSGTVKLMVNGVLHKEFNKSDLIHGFYFLTNYDESVELVADTACEVYKVLQSDFNETMSFYDMIPLSIMNSYKIVTKNRNVIAEVN